ncbi:MAG: DUF3419 family protein [Bacilli bacterium]|nr:DUF3419 family protein [Bacilli bacterium]
MKELPKDIEVGLGMLAGAYIRPPKNYGKSYIRTNEALSRYYTKFPIEDGRVLTVAASGDHILQAVCNGAKVIDAFDKNRFQLYVSKLKIAALKALTQDEFAQYFCFKRNGDFFNDLLWKELYLKIREKLDFDSVVFWDTMYQNGDLENNLNKFFHLQTFVDDGHGSFAFDENYEKTKENLEDVQINLYHSTFHSFVDKLNDGLYYDAIFMSNITDYLEDDEFLGLTDFLNTEVHRHLNSGGKVAVYTPPHRKYMGFGEYVDPDGMAEENKVYIYTKR